MRIGIISDIHSNLEALQEVISEIKELDKIICLGDIVGYGPDPELCIEIIREYAAVVLAGNHDWGVCEKTDISSFNNVARFAIEWTKDRLNDEQKNYDLVDKSLIAAHYDKAINLKIGII